LQQGNEQTVLAELDQIPAINATPADPQTARHVLAAVAAGWALALDIDVLRTAVQTYGIMPTEAAPE
jgi:hypothetical protein